MRDLCGKAVKVNLNIETNFFKTVRGCSQNLRDLESWLKSRDMYDYFSRLSSLQNNEVILLNGRSYFSVTNEEFIRDYKVL